MKIKERQQLYEAQVDGHHQYSGLCVASGTSVGHDGSNDERTYNTMKKAEL